MSITTVRLQAEIEQRLGTLAFKLKHNGIARYPTHKNAIIMLRIWHGVENER